MRCLLAALSIFVCAIPSAAAQAEWRTALVVAKVEKQEYIMALMDTAGWVEAHPNAISVSSVERLTLKVNKIVAGAIPTMSNDRVEVYVVSHALDFTKMDSVTVLVRTDPAGRAKPYSMWDWPRDTACFPADFLEGTEVESYFTSVVDDDKCGAIP
jgi:hypothetical protein